MGLPDNTVKLYQTVNKISLFAGPVIGTGGGGGSVSNGRITNIEQAINSGYTVTAGFAPYMLVGATASHAATIWTAITSGTQITSLKNWDGTTAASLATNVDGGLYFQAPVANTTLYVDLGSTRIRVDRIFTIVHTHAISDVTNLQTSLDAKADASHTHAGVYVAVSAVGAANGLATLDSGSKVPSAQIPDLSATYTLKTREGANNGVATLDSGGHIPSAQLPTLGGTYIPTSAAGAANGVATLDSGSKITAAQDRVTTVNTFVGDVVLTASDVGTYSSSAIDALTAENPKVPLIIREVTGSYAARNTATTNAARPVFWIGADPPSIGGGFAINDVDVWFVTP